MSLNPIKAATRLLAAVTGSVAAPSATSSYAQKCLEEMTTEDGARSLAERLQVARVAPMIANSPRRTRLDQQIAQLNLAIETKEWGAQVAATDAALQKAIALNAADQAEAVSKLAAAVQKVERCTTEVQQRRRKAAPQIRAAEESDAALAATMAREEAEALAQLNTAESVGDENAAQAAAERLAQAQANRQRSLPAGSKSPAALRAGVLAGLVEEAQAELNAATQEATALRVRLATCQLNAALHQSDRTATLHLLAAAEVLHCQAQMPTNSARGASGSWWIPTVAVANVAHVPGARQAVGPESMNRLLPERVVERAERALRSINFSVFEVDPATISGEPEGDAADQAQKLGRLK